MATKKKPDEEAQVFNLSIATHAYPMELATLSGKIITDTDSHIVIHHTVSRTSRMDFAAIPKARIAYYWVSPEEEGVDKVTFRRVSDAEISSEVVDMSTLEIGADGLLYCTTPSGFALAIDPTLCTFSLPGESTGKKGTFGGKSVDGDDDAIPDLEPAPEAPAPKAGKGAKAAPAAPVKAAKGAKGSKGAKAAVADDDSWGG